MFGVGAALLGVAIRSELRSRGRQLLVIALLVAVASGAVMVTAAGARRTATAYDRRVAAANERDGTVSGANQGASAGADERKRALVAAEPDVARAELVWGTSIGLAFDQGAFANLVVDPSLVGDPPYVSTHLLDGRMVAEGADDEVVVNESLADLLGLSVGDALVLPTFDPAAFAAFREGDVLPAYDGPAIPVDVVGIARLDDDLVVQPDTSLIALASPAFRERWSGLVGGSGTNVSYWLRPGVDRDAFARDLGSRLPGSLQVLSTGSGVADEVHTATDVLALALWGFSAIAAVAGAVVGTGLIGRHLDGVVDANRSLRALGIGPRQRTLLWTATTTLTVAAGAVVGSLLGVAASPLVPFGYARRVEPDPGVFVDLPILAGTSTVVVTWGVVAATAQARAADRRLGRQERGKPIRLHRVPTSLAVPTGLGVRRARHTASGLAAASIAAALLVALAFVAQSADDLVHRPDRWGWTWSTSPERGFPSERFDAEVARLERDGLRVGFIQSTVLDVGQDPVELIAPDQVDVQVLDGDLPSTDGEVALGRRTLRASGKQIGDTFPVVDVNDQVRHLEIVGTVVPPYTVNGHHPGEGAVIVSDPPLIEQLAERNQQVAFSVIVTYPDGTDARALEERLTTDPGWRFYARAYPRPPGAIVNVDRVRPVLPWLAGLLAGMWAIRLHHGLTTTRRRDHDDVRTLIALGFRPADLRRLFVSEAATTVGIGLAFGAVLGLGVGRWGWRSVTDRLGLPSTAEVPVTALAALSGLSLLLALASGLRAGSIASAHRSRRHEIVT